MKHTYLLFIWLPFLIASCATLPDVGEVSPERVISRSDQLKSRPEWLKESEVIKIESGYLVSLGSSIIPDNSNIAQGYRIAESNAKTQVINAIEIKLENIFQNAEEGVSIESSQARNIATEISHNSLSGLISFKRYWERVALMDSSGVTQIQYRIFATVRIDEGVFKKAVQQAIRAKEGKGLSKGFAEKVDERWNEMTSDLHTSAL